LSSWTSDGTAQQKELDKALDIYQAAVDNKGLPQQDRRSFEAMINRLR
jgi:hypothetical protein